MTRILNLLSHRLWFVSIVATLKLLTTVNAAAPNVLILVADDLGWADVPWRGSPARMPNLDRLRQDGTELIRFYGAPLCSPSRAALYTGRSAAQLNIRDVFSGRDDGLSTLEHLMPESFRAAGYQTALTGKWHLGSDSTHVPNARGFDHFYGFLSGAISYFTHVGENTTRVDWQRDGVTLNEAGYSTDLIRDEEIRLLRTRDPARPFFHVVTFNAPHIPLEAPTDLLANYPTLSGDAKTYAAMLESLDIAIGRILSELTAQRLDANTVVVFYSDNGGPGNSVARNTPLRGSKTGVYEGGVRVPAIIRQPGVIRAGVTTDQFTTVQDLFPTLAAATGVTPRNRLPLDGLNLWDTLRGATAPADRTFTVVSTTDSAQYEGRWKLVAHATSVELYDLVADQSETTNQANSQPAITTRLRNALTAALDRSLSATSSGDARVTNLSARAAVGGTAGTPILGFYVAGGDKRLVIRGVGPTLGAFGVTGTLADPIVELRQGQTLVQANDNWLAGDAATIAASGAFALPNGSLDAALVLTLKPEAYTAQTRGANNGSGIALVEIFDADANASSSRLVNASTRAFVGTGAAVLIPGIAVSGSGNAGLLVRAAGPALAKFGLSGVLADPVITVYRGNEVVGLNDDWGVAQTSQYAAAQSLPSPVAALNAAAQAVGAFPFDSGSRDAALLITLPGGTNYTVQVSGKNNTSGTALVEFYLVP
jgi:arylsulfatase A-like enzyme/predicted RecA/RadA family phage recombinase